MLGATSERPRPPDQGGVKRESPEREPPTSSAPGMDVDPSTANPACLASLLISNEDGGLTCAPYPLTDAEPPTLVIDAATEAAMNVFGSDKEIKDPQDYVPKQSQHNLLVQPRCYISTDASADLEKVVLDVVKDAKLKLFDLERSRHTAGGDWNAHQRKVSAEQQRLNEMEAKLVPQSTELHADRIKATFNPDTALFRIEATYTNPTGVPISATITQPNVLGPRFVSSEVVQHGYVGVPEFTTNDEAKQVFDKLCASKTQGASLQSVDRATYSQTANVPAFAPRAANGARKRAQFTAVWILACEDVEGKAHLLPQREGNPRRHAYDFAVQPPLQLGNKAVPFDFTIEKSLRTMTLDMPSRAAATLDAERRGVPTWWVKPDAPERADRAYHLHFSTPSRHPPCICFRFTNEGYDDDDFPLEALGSLTLAKSEEVTAKVLSYARAGGDRDCVARIRVCVPRGLRIRTSTRCGYEFVIVTDFSGSMGQRQGGSPLTRRELVVQEVTLLCEKLLKFPEAFKKAGIVGPDDTFELTIVGFHSSASFTCERIPLERTQVEAAVASFRARTDTGGTIYTSWAQLLNSTPRGDKVALCLLTDGALWDEGEFVYNYASLKAKVGEFAACAIGCGSWANHGTVKLVSTIENGEALITEVNSAVSCKSAQLLGKCLAATATKVPIAVDGRVLSHTGMQELPDFVTGPNGAQSVYTVGLGATIECTLACKYADDNSVLVPALRVGDGNEPVCVQSLGARHDPADVLRHVDPLFVGTGTTVFKDEMGARKAALIGIGRACKTTTSEVTKVIRYTFDSDDDNSLKPHTRAAVPAFDPEVINKGLEWLKLPPSTASADQLVRTEFELMSVHYHHGCGGGLGMYDDGSDCGGAVFRSLGADDEPAAYTSLSACSDAPPAYRSLGSGNAPAPAPAPAPTTTKKAEVDESVDPNATPTFEAASKLLLNERLLAYLNDPTLAHYAIKGVVDAFTEMGKQLWDLKKSDVVKADPMADIVDQVCAAVAGPSYDDITNGMWPLLAVLCTFAMRFHVNVDLNLHNAPIEDGDVDTAILRTSYLLRIAERVHEIACEHKRPLWRAVLTTKEVAYEPLLPGCDESSSNIKSAITWEQEDLVRGEKVHKSSDKAAVTNAMQRAARDLRLNFHNGGYKGGRWASDNLVEGPKPREFSAFVIVMPNMFVEGDYIAVDENVYKPAWEAIGKLSL